MSTTGPGAEHLEDRHGVCRLPGCFRLHADRGLRASPAETYLFLLLPEAREEARALSLQRNAEETERLSQAHATSCSQTGSLIFYLLPGKNNSHLYHFLQGQGLRGWR